MNTPPSSGPITVVTPKTAPSAPWYWPRSRSGMTSAISAVDVTVSAPPPSPCTARNVISSSMLFASPQKNEPTMNTSTPSWNTRLRPNRSPNFPASTVDTVSASMYAVTTQLTWPAPPRSPTMVGSAVDTIVWSSADSSRPSMIVTNTTFIWTRDSSGPPAAAGASPDSVTVTWLIRPPTIRLLHTGRHIYHPRARRAASWTRRSGRRLSVGVWTGRAGRGSRAEVGELRGPRGQPDGGP